MFYGKVAKNSRKIESIGVLYRTNMLKMSA